MELDDLDDLLGPRQMRNCLPCKQRKIKCELARFRRKPK